MNITIVTTGGTIAKTYNEWDGSLRNDRPVVESILASLRHPDINVRCEHILNKDSLDLTETDRVLITNVVRRAAGSSDAVVIVHGTDTLTVTGDRLHRELADLKVPIVLTGAMRPYEFRDSDAGQNMTEALLACRLLPAGVYVAMHNRVLRFPGVRKDRTTLTFVYDNQSGPVSADVVEAKPL